MFSQAEFWRIVPLRTQGPCLTVQNNKVDPVFLKRCLYRLPPSASDGPRPRSFLITPLVLGFQQLPGVSWATDEVGGVRDA